VEPWGAAGPFELELVRAWATTGEAEALEAVALEGEAGWRRAGTDLRPSAGDLLDACGAPAGFAFGGERDDGLLAPGLTAESPSLLPWRCLGVACGGPAAAAPGFFPARAEFWLADDDLAAEALD